MAMMARCSSRRQTPSATALLALLGVLTTTPAAAAARPNILFIFTDDQDIVLNSLTVMPKLKKLVIDEGAFFENAFCNTPICCPSRAEVTTGRYMHNTKATNNGCGGREFQENQELDNVAHFAAKGGYDPYYSGKYLNNYGSAQMGGTAHIPRGWKEWHALVGNSKYYNVSDTMLVQCTLENANRRIESSPSDSRSSHWPLGCSTM
jgi:N-acetylglucosamine-6-sulfatase